MPNISLIGLVWDYIAILESIIVARGMERVDWLHTDLDVDPGPRAGGGWFPKEKSGYV